MFFLLIFALKHRLWVAVLTCTYYLCKKNIKNNHLKIIIFTAVKNLSMLHRRVIVMICAVLSTSDLFAVCLGKIIHIGF